ncbi:group III truncated hemoglobin [Pseudopontixanthobacter vadosimaris]|uniref:group III truncated hemoglobin n=1 Tax=Pseudopontixanthobacter vadosimaris TaxID=2726450 RepID=UPI001F0D0F27|nr:group III truncated hemoglobin [Pseudopontixanthobacter vadosimaris]
MAKVKEAELETLIPAFYARVRSDDLIGPVFEQGVSDWNIHLGKLVDFWSSVMLTSGRYKGNPVASHLKHKDVLTPDMFDRWLALWTEVTGELLRPETAAQLQDKADRIAESLKLALWFRLPAGSPAPLTRQQPTPASPALPQTAGTPAAQE